MNPIRISFLIFVSFAIISPILAQKNPQNEACYSIVYEKFQNEKLIPDDTIVLKFHNNVAWLLNNTKNESYFIDYQERSINKIIHFKSQNYKVTTSFDSLPIPSASIETEKILGYVCRKIKYTIFSNTVEVWYSTEAQAKGSPSLSYIPENALVLKSIMNGNFVIQAKYIKNISKPCILNYPLEGNNISESKYRSLQINSRYTTLNVFRNEQINFEDGLAIPTELEPGKSYRFSKGTILMKKVTLPEIKTGGSVFIKLINWSNGDAYDRTGCAFTLSSKKAKSILNALKNGLNELPILMGKNGENFQGIIATENYSPVIELMRFFTSFGVSHFNNRRPIDGYPWADSVVYKQDITELIPTDEKEIWIGVFIGNYDKGGHKISLDLMYYPPEEALKAKTNYIQPLFCTLNVMEASGQNYGKMFRNDTLRVEFELPEGIGNLKMLYTTTGHGGWENGDEFKPKMNRILIDGSEVFKIVPWRTDCATYRLSNPASGNFGNGMSSSDYSRSNWCPATLTPPYHIPLSSLSPGKHRIEVIIDQGEDEGGSFNHWNISGILTGTKN